MHAKVIDYCHCCQINSPFRFSHLFEPHEWKLNVPFHNAWPIFQQLPKPCVKGKSLSHMEEVTCSIYVEVNECVLHSFHEKNLRTIGDRTAAKTHCILFLKDNSKYYCAQEAHVWCIEYTVELFRVHSFSSRYSSWVAVVPQSSYLIYWVDVSDSSMSELYTRYTFIRLRCSPWWNSHTPLWCR